MFDITDATPKGGLTQRSLDLCVPCRPNPPQLVMVLEYASTHVNLQGACIAKKRAFAKGSIESDDY